MRPYTRGRRNGGRPPFGFAQGRQRVAPTSGQEVSLVRHPPSRTLWRTGGYGAHRVLPNGQESLRHPRGLCASGHYPILAGHCSPSPRVLECAS